MESTQNYMNNSQDIVNKTKKTINSETIENLNYLYPNGHRITHQMRWFKGSRDRCLRSDIAA